MVRVALLLLTACGRIAFESSTDAGSATDADAEQPMLDAPAPNAVVEVGAGGVNTCVRLGSGDVWCWGRGDVGGNGPGSTAMYEATPRLVPSSVAFVALDVHDSGACGLVADGTARCWGLNNNGALGLGHFNPVFAPEQPGISDIAEIALAGAGACIRTRTGSVTCAGQPLILGDNTFVTRPTFGVLPVITDAIALAGGDFHICALRTSGAVVCWGRNFEGQLGVAGPDSAVPVDGPAGPYISIVAGDNFTCALRAAGTVDCWGVNSDGQLGDSTTTSRSSAAPVTGITDAIQIVGASDTGCALLRSGPVMCWGDDGDHALGNMDFNSSSVPLTVNISDVIELSAQTSVHVCARKRDASVWCWGQNFYGQLSTATGYEEVPTQVSGLP